MDLLEIKKIDWKKAMVRSNEYTAATYSLSPDAHRILWVAISAIAQNDQCFTTYRIYVKELITFFPALHSDKNAMARIDKATDALMGSYIKIKQKNGWIKKNLVHSCQYNKNSGHPYVDIKLDNDMLPHLIGVNGYFSSPKLDNIRFFKKDQHFKLHAYFYSFLYRHSTGVVSIKDLRQILDIDKKQYQLVWHLKSRLLNPSIKLINEVTDIHISTEEVKEGRKITGFIFNITKNTAISSSNPIQSKLWEISASDDLHRSYAILGISTVDFNALLKKHDAVYLKQLLLYVKYKQWQIKIDSIKGYVFGILNKKPPLDELLTPRCLMKAQEKKRHILDLKDKQHLEHQQKKTTEASEKTNARIQYYLQQRSDSELWIIKTAFNKSIFSRGFKTGQENLDFEKPIVKAVFYNFVHIKYMEADSN